MKGIRSLFRLGALAMVAVLVVVALTMPATAAADQTCSKDKMLDEVLILSVNPVKSTLNWTAADLLSYGEGEAGTYPTGQLEVKFNDINTPFRITHYKVTATPSGEPGTSKELGVKEKDTEVARPSEVGSTVTAVLDLEPGTNYDVDVVAYYYSIKVSPEQSNQDSLGGTTYLSPPFFGGGIGLDDSDLETLSSPADRGVHFLVYRDEQELHTLRWLNPKKFGPFDHIWHTVDENDDGDTADDDDVPPGKEGADILCSNNDGDLLSDCDLTHDDYKGLTHYRVTVTDAEGNIEYIENIEVIDADVYSAEFNLNDGTYTFALDAGYLDGTKFYALSDKAQVEFDIPDDYRKYNQDDDEIAGLLDDIADMVAGEADDFDAFYDSLWDYTGYNADGTSVKKSADLPGKIEGTELEEQTYKDAANPNRTTALIIYLNNLYN